MIQSQSLQEGQATHVLRRGRGQWLTSFLSTRQGTSPSRIPFQNSLIFDLKFSSKYRPTGVGVSQNVVFGCTWRPRAAGVSPSFLPSEAFEEGLGRKMQEVRGITGGIFPKTPSRRARTRPHPLPWPEPPPTTLALLWLKHTRAECPGAAGQMLSQACDPWKVLVGKQLHSVHEKEAPGSWCPPGVAQGPWLCPCEIGLGWGGHEGRPAALRAQRGQERPAFPWLSRCPGRVPTWGQ